VKGPFHPEEVAAKRVDGIESNNGQPRSAAADSQSYPPRHSGRLQPGFSVSRVLLPLSHDCFQRRGGRALDERVGDDATVRIRSQAP
jgi:hypothetical protein